MKLPKSPQWSKLDNAGKIFPPTSSKSDPKVFRFSCEMYEPVDSDSLQKALDKTIEEFPQYKMILRKGVFWFFLENTRQRPMVLEEHLRPCSPIYVNDYTGLLFRVIYYKRRISLELYHALADGTGALNFLRVLIYHYVLIVHGDDFTEFIPKFNDDASFEEKSDDSFNRYYEKPSGNKPQKNSNVYRIRALRLPDYNMHIIEGEMSAKQVIEKAREQGITVTGLFAAALLISIYQQMTIHDRKKNIIISVPVNLRKYFHSESARNFFGVVKIVYKFPPGGAGLQEVAKAVADYLKENLTPERLSRQMNWYSALEHNLLARIVPLSLKNIGLYIAGLFSDRQETCSLSNLGRVDMPSEFSKYIRLFDVFNSGKYLKICMVSFNDNMVVSFTSPFVSTGIQKSFFRILSSMGIDITIHSNYPGEEEQSAKM